MTLCYAGFYFVPSTEQHLISLDDNGRLNLTISIRNDIKVCQVSDIL